MPEIKSKKEKNFNPNSPFPQAAQPTFQHRPHYQRKDSNSSLQDIPLTKVESCSQKENHLIIELGTKSSPITEHKNPSVNWINSIQTTTQTEMPLNMIIAEDGTFRDQFHRSLWLRGVNICSKIPCGAHCRSDSDGHTFYEHKNISFINEPLPLEMADEHFTRLKIWGLTLIRLGVTWESLEHEGPGLYDEKYIQYLVALIEKANSHGFKVIIDPHQDVWSRFSGGSGAPGWSFEVAGMDLTKFRNTGAAHVHLWDMPKNEQVMLWPTNYTKLATQTLFTLFFGGNTFAPKTLYQGEPVQDFLQRHYIQSFAYLAKKLSHLEAIIGFEVMNEPHYGYIGLKDLSKYDYDKNLHLGFSPSALQGMALGSGIPQKVDFYVRSFPWPTRSLGKKWVNEKKENVWFTGECIWAKHGVWGLSVENGKEVPRLFSTDYFSKDPKTGRLIQFERDFYLPFVKKYIQAIREASGNNGKWFYLVEPVPNEDPMQVETQQDCEALGTGKDFVYAPHWYDLSTVFSKSFSPMISHNVQELSRGSRNLYKHTFFGQAGIQKNYHKQISNIVNQGREALNLPNQPKKGIPVIFGECGIPMDMNDHRGFSRSDYTLHNMALDSMFRAMEKVKVNGFTLWNYYPKNELHVGDSWNGEDFSVYSKSVADLVLNSSQSLDNKKKFWNWYIGGRALEALLRTYASKVAGDLISSEFCMKTKTYTLHYKTVKQTDQSESLDLQYQTEIFVPEFQYVDQQTGEIHLDIQISDGSFEYHPEKQCLYVWHHPEVIFHTVEIKKSTTRPQLKGQKLLAQVDAARLLDLPLKMTFFERKEMKFLTFILSIVVLVSIALVLLFP